MVAISVCLPVYNGERYLAQAIETVIEQSFGDFEIIIADDCSRDSSAEIAQRYAKQDKRVRFIQNERNIGLFQNYNRCIELAQGKFIKPFAQDDLLERRMFEKMIAEFEANPDVALVSTAKRWVDEEGRALQSFKLFPSDMLIGGWEVIRYNMIQLSNWVGEPSTVMFRAEQRGTGFDTTLFHYGDIEYWFRIVQNSKMLYLADELCGFRRHSKSATSKNLSGMYFALDVLKLGEKYGTYLEEIGESRQHFTKRALEVIAINMDHLVRNESLVLGECLDARPSQMPIDEARAFKELSFDAVRYITDLLAQISALEHQKEDQRKHYEKVLDDIHSSTSWKLTAPLRAVQSSLRDA